MKDTSTYLYIKARRGGRPICVYASDDIKKVFRLSDQIRLKHHKDLHVWTDTAGLIWIRTPDTQMTQVA